MNLSGLLDLIHLVDQMGAVDATFDELSSIFDTGGSKGLTGDMVNKIPKIKITCKNNLDASGNKDSCSVCLQVSFGPNLLFGNQKMSTNLSCEYCRIFNLVRL